MVDEGVSFRGVQGELFYAGDRLIDEDDPLSGYRYIFAYGSVRSGKSRAGVHGFIRWAGLNFRGKKFLISAHTMGQIRDNLLPMVAEAAGDAGLVYEERMNNKRVLVGDRSSKNTFLVYEGNSSASAPKIQGHTFAGALLDEATLMPSSYIAEVVSRCSERGAKIWMLMNPESASHPLKKEFLDRADQLKLYPIHFTLRDNPHLDPDYVENLERTLTGPYYRWRVLGEWATASGRVFTDWKVERPPQERPTRWEIGVDPGIAGTTHATLAGLWGDTWYAVDEYRWDTYKEGRQRPDSEHAEGIKAMLGRNEASPYCFWVDPHGMQLKAELGKQFPHTRVLDAENHVLDGIQLTSAWLSRGVLKIAPSCVYTLDEIETYVWDTKAAERGISKPVKDRDHAMDSLRYIAYSSSKHRRREIVNV